MCLDRVTKTYDGSQTLIESGWKYFNGDEFPHNKWNNAKKCPLDKWITATGGEINAYPGRYEAGFHVFTDEAKARKLSVQLRRVYFRRPVAKGLDQNIETIVVREMYVPSKEDTWPPKG